jgi:hypothetical protein
MPAEPGVVARGSSPAAKYRPSGDQEISAVKSELGTVAPTGNSLTCDSDPPSADTTWMRAAFSNLRRNAMRRPSGDQLGA